MAEELGRIQRPPASQYDGRRKLLLVPLIYGPQADDPVGAEVLQNYWEQMQTQVEALESALGGLQHLYHESLTVGGDEGLEQLGAADQRSHTFITNKTQSGADSDLSPDGDDVAAVMAKIEIYQPKLLAFTAKRPAQVFLKTAFGRGKIDYGLQPDRAASTAIFVLPSSSGLAIRWWEPKWWHEAAELHRKFS